MSEQAEDLLKAADALQEAAQEDLSFAGENAAELTRLSLALKSMSAEIAELSGYQRYVL